MNLYDKTKGLTSYRGQYLVSDEILPVRRNQAYEELMMVQKRLAASIYVQKDREGRHP